MARKFVAIVRTFIKIIIIDDIITDESLDKRGKTLLELAISGRHCNHYLWFLS